MKKEGFLISKKIALLILFFSVLSNQYIYSQCTNTDPTGDSAQNFCKVDNRTVANLVADGVLIAWFDASVDGNQYSSYEPLFDGVTYYADDIDGGGCSPNRLAVTVSIFGDVPTNVDVFVGKCASENPTIADLSATGSNIEWFDAQIDGNLLALTEVLMDSQTYWVQQTENGCTSNRLPTTVNLVEPPPPVVEATQSFCFPPNPTVADLQATGTNVIWYEFENSTIPLNSSTPLIDGEDYWATESSFPCESTIRIQTTVILDATPDAGSDGSYTECEIDLTTTNLFDLLGGTPDDTGSWTGPSALSNGYLGTFEPGTNVEGTYTYTVSSALRICPDATANVTVLITIVPTPTITESTQIFCEIDNATIADLAVTGTNILWYDTETSTTPLSDTDVLIDGEDYWAVDSDTASGCESVTRVVVTATIITVPPPTTSQSNQTFCEIENPTIADLAIIGDGILWYDTENSTTPLSDTDILIDGEDYWATQTGATSGCESDVRLVVNVAINTPPPPTTTESNQIFCEIDNATIADINVTGDGIQWYDTETSTIPISSSDLLVEGEDYWATQTDPISGCESATRLVVTVTINITIPPTTTESSQVFCINDFLPSSPTIADLNVTGDTILWYDTETSTSPLSDTDTLIDGEDYWATQTNAVTGCESPKRLIVNAVIIDPPTPTTSEVNQTFCVADNPTVFNLQATGDTVIWYDTETSTNPLNENDLLIDGEDYWAANSDATIGCESTSKLMVTVSFNDIVPATISNISQTFCASDLPTVSNLQATGNGIVWYPTETETSTLDTTELLIDGEDYWAAQTDTTTGCTSSTRVVVTVNLTDPGTPNIISLGNEFCKIDNPTVSDLNSNISPLNGGTITWYDTYPGGSILSLSELLVEGESYYAIESGTDGCTTINALEVIVSLESCNHQYDVEIYDGFSPTGNGINDTFKLENLRTLYPDFKIEFYNRWGNLVYTANSSKPDWNGRLNGDGELVTAGVYYYIIYFNKNNRKPIQRRLYLSR